MSLYYVPEVELSYRRPLYMNERPFVTNSEQAYRILVSQWDENKIDFIEQAKVILLSQSLQILGLFNVASGGLTETLFDPRLVFAAALKSNATNVILAHNHPSGNPEPSRVDIALTKRFKEAGKLLSIDVRDHIIVTKDGYHSFADELSYEKVQTEHYFSFSALAPF